MSDPMQSDEINKKRAELEERRRKRDSSDFRQVVSTAEGRRFVWRILSEGKAFHSCFDLNAIQMAKNEGKRDMALFLLTDLIKDHQAQYLQMCREAKSDKQNHALEIKSIIEGDNND